MKNLAKILSLLFAVVALVGVFTFAVSAETDGGATSNVAIEEIGADGQVIRSTNDNLFNWGTTGGGMDLKTVQNGSTIKCYQDVYLREGNVYFNHGFNITIDLNGHTLYLCDKNGTGRTFDFGYGESTPTTYVVKNGTITDNNQSASRIQSRAYMTLVFEDITFDFKNGGYIYDRCSEKIVFDGCTVTSKAKQLVTRSNDASKEVNATYVFNDFTVTTNSREDYRFVNIQRTTKDVKVVYSGNSVFNVVCSENIYAADNFTGAATLEIAEGVKFGRNVPLYDVEKNITSKYYSDITLGADYNLTYGAEIKNAYVNENLVLDSFAIQSNLTLYSDFNLNFYVPAEVGVTSATFADGTALDVTNVLIGEDEYTKLTLKGIAANKVADNQTIVINYASFGAATVSFDYSVLSYANTLLESDYEDAKTLVAAAIYYVFEAYSYTSAESDELNATLEGYGDYIPDAAEVADVATDKGQTGNAIESAQFALGTEIKLVLNLEAGFTGTLTVNGVEFNVVDGKCDELTYVAVPVTAADLYDKAITIKAADAEGTYSLADYITEAADGEEGALLAALNTYCYAAKTYLANHPNLD